MKRVEKSVYVKELINELEERVLRVNFTYLLGRVEGKYQF